MEPVVLFLAGVGLMFITIAAVCWWEKRADETPDPYREPWQ